MRNIEVYIEQIPEDYVSDINITITCKKSELHEAEAIIDYLRSMVNITFKKERPYKVHAALKRIGVIRW
jgi:hypothetical protein